MALLPLHKLPPHAPATVYAILEHTPLRRRLRELGLDDGASVTCLTVGAHKDIAIYRICGAQIALRDCDAERVIVRWEGRA